MSDVRYEVSERTATVTIDRPGRRNALNSKVLGQLRESLIRARDDDEVGVIVLTGAGERAFSAGGDLAPGGAMGTGPLHMHWDRGAFADLLLECRRVGKPIVARVNGDALGGGFGLMLAADLIIGREDARLGCPEINVGLFPMMIMALMARNVPRKLAVELMLTGKKITVAEAATHYVVNRAVPGSELDSAVNELCATLLSKSPAILRLGLESFHTMSEMALEPALRYLQSSLTINTMAADAAEGITAFLQKRQPEWKGR